MSISRSNQKEAVVHFQQHRKIIRKGSSSGQRFRFDKESDLALANAVLLAKAHIARNGEIKKKIQERFKCSALLIL